MRAFCAEESFSSISLTTVYPSRCAGTAVPELEPDAVCRRHRQRVPGHLRARLPLRLRPVPRCCGATNMRHCCRVCQLQAACATCCISVDAQTSLVSTNRFKRGCVCGMQQARPTSRASAPGLAPTAALGSSAACWASCTPASPPLATSTRTGKFSWQPLLQNRISRIDYCTAGLAASGNFRADRCGHTSQASSCAPRNSVNSLMRRHASGHFSGNFPLRQACYILPTS